MNINRAQLSKGWGNLGVNKGTVVMVHSSLKSLGTITGPNREALDKIAAAKEVIGSIRDAIGDNGTMIVPTLSGTLPWYRPKTYSLTEAKKCEWHPKMSQFIMPIMAKWEKTVKDPNMPFHSVPDIAPYLWPPGHEWNTDRPTTTSTLSEVFRTMKSAVRSIHPTHSVSAMGPLAEQITANHIFAETPCGIGSPYEKLYDLDAQILLMGVGLNRCTYMHFLEDMSGVIQNCDINGPTLIKIANVGKVWFLLHNRADREFGLFEQVLIKKGCIVEGFVGKARVLLINDIHKMTNIVCDIWRNNPLYGYQGIKIPDK